MMEVATFGPHSITSAGVTIRSTRKSCAVSGSASSTTYSAWAMVTMKVRGLMSPASWSRATSGLSSPRSAELGAVAVRRHAAGDDHVDGPYVGDTDFYGRAVGSIRRPSSVGVPLKWLDR
jgi:hypothetical protein